MKIYKLGTSSTLDFAAAELKRILEKTTSEKFEVCKTDDYVNNNGLYLGMFGEFPHINPLNNDFNEYDDEIAISVAGRNGIIAGINARSVLIGVYRYVTELGCRFTGFGEQGEYLPDIDLESTKVFIQERAFYKHRGVCIEGAVTEENVLQMVDLLPKLGMNSYFIQFREAYTFFDRFYRHLGNPKLESYDAMPVSLARRYVKNIECEIKKRDLLYHAVGHGWTCEPFGIPGLAWEKWEGEISDEILSNFAMINGKRGLFEGIPLNTNACYSKKKTRDAITDEIVNYAKTNNNVDLLHVWLADGTNNQCECLECKKNLPSDLYVLMLNELDAKLTAQNIDTKIVFLIYVDLLWPPTEYKIINSGRFLIMFAPITRSYRKSFKPEGEIPEISEYNRNHNEMPKDVASNIAFLKKWQDIFRGGGFDYDYHYMWQHVYDPGYIQIAGVLFEDIKYLGSLKLDGYISCQVSRAAFPNALGLYVMGKTLWDKNADFHAIAMNYYKSAYGDNWCRVYDYLSKLSELYFEINFEKPIISESKPRAEICRRALKVLNDFKNNVGFTTYSKHINQKISWLYLEMHNKIWYDFTDALLSLFKGDKNSAKTKWLDLKSFIFENEAKYQSVFDAWNFNNVMNKYFE